MNGTYTFDIFVCYTNSNRIIYILFIMFEMKLNSKKKYQVEKNIYLLIMSCNTQTTFNFLPLS